MAFIARERERFLHEAGEVFDKLALPFGELTAAVRGGNRRTVASFLFNRLDGELRKVARTDASSGSYKLSQLLDDFLSSSITGIARDVLPDLQGRLTGSLTEIGGAVNASDVNLFDEIIGEDDLDGVAPEAPVVAADQYAVGDDVLAEALDGSNGVAMGPNAGHVVDEPRGEYYGREDAGGADGRYNDSNNSYDGRDGRERYDDRMMDRQHQQPPPQAYRDADRGRGWARDEPPRSHRMDDRSRSRERMMHQMPPPPAAGGGHYRPESRSPPRGYPGGPPPPPPRGGGYGGPSPPDHYRHNDMPHPSSSSSAAGAGPSVRHPEPPGLNHHNNRGSAAAGVPMTPLDIMRFVEGWVPGAAGTPVSDVVSWARALLREVETRPFDTRSSVPGGGPAAVRAAFNYILLARAAVFIDAFDHWRLKAAPGGGPRVPPSEQYRPPCPPIGPPPTPEAARSKLLECLSDPLLAQILWLSCLGDAAVSALSVALGRPLQPFEPHGMARLPVKCGFGEIIGGQYLLCDVLVTSGFRLVADLLSQLISKCEAALKSCNEREVIRKPIGVFIALKRKVDEGRKTAAPPMSLADLQAEQSIVRDVLLANINNS